MKTSNNIVLNRTKQTESFGDKARLLQLDLHTQIDMLNKLYKGNVIFGYAESSFSSAKGIVIKDIGEDVISIELPEVDGYNMDNLLSLELIFGIHKRNLVSIKMPKCLKELEISPLYNWMRYINRIFVWDTTKVTFNIDRGLSSDMGKLEMVAMLSSSGGKNKVIKLK